MKTLSDAAKLWRPFGAAEAMHRIDDWYRRGYVMFSDVQGFTTIAERMDPEELMHITSTYFQALTDTLLEQHATIDKYIGDAIMAIWNAPKRDLAHAMHGCRGALHAKHLTLQLEQEFAVRGWPRLHTRFGTPVKAVKALAGGVEIDAGIAERFDLAVVA